MPIYEFRCNACRRRTSVFTRSVGATITPACEHCGSADLARIMSRVAVLRSGGEAGPGAMPDMSDVDENDPRSVARWVRKMSREMGEPLEPEMEAGLERMEAGESLDDFDGDGDGVDDDFDDGGF